MFNKLNKFRNKTFKREVSTILLGLLMYIAIGVNDVEMVKVLAWPIFTFAGLSFGLDWQGKRGNSVATDTSEQDMPPDSLR